MAIIHLLLTLLVCEIVHPCLRNMRFSEFWGEKDPERRFEMIRAARGGGSMTPEVDKTLWVRVTLPITYCHRFPICTQMYHSLQDAQTISARVKLQFGVDVRRVEYRCDPSGGAALSHKRFQVEFSNGQTSWYDIILLGTGFDLDVAREPLLQV